MTKYDTSGGYATNDSEPEPEPDEAPFPCTRDDCDEGFDYQLVREIHLARDHEPPWEADES